MSGVWRRTVKKAPAWSKRVGRRNPHPGPLSRGEGANRASRMRLEPPLTRQPHMNAEPSSPLAFSTDSRSTSMHLRRQWQAVTETTRYCETQCFPPYVTRWRPYASKADNGPREAAVSRAPGTHTKGNGSSANHVSVTLQVLRQTATARSAAGCCKCRSAGAGHPWCTDGTGPPDA